MSARRWSPAHRALPGSVVPVIAIVALVAASVLLAWSAPPTRAARAAGAAVAPPPTQVSLSFGGRAFPTAVAVGADGGLVAAVNADPTATEPARSYLVHITGEGALDPAFGTAERPGVVPSEVPTSQLVVLPDGRFLAAGGSDVARLEASGAVDPTFTRTRLGYQVGAIAPVADGSTLVAGGDAGDPTLVLWRLDANGALDPSYGPDLGVLRTTIPGWATDLVMLADGTFVVSVAEYRNLAATTLVHLGPRGELLDPLPQGHLDGIKVSDLAVDRAGGLLFGASDFGFGYGVGRLTPQLTLDTAFDPAGHAGTMALEGGPPRAALAPLADGSFAVASTVPMRTGGGALVQVLDVTGASTGGYLVPEGVGVQLVSLGDGRLATVAVDDDLSTIVVRTDTPRWPLPGPDLVGAVPERVLDTRLGVGAPAGKPAAGGVLAVAVAGFGRPAVPDDTGAVALNVTVTEADEAGYLTVWACGEPRPYTSNLNYVAGQTVANAVVADVGGDGRVCVLASGATHVVADVDGWFGAPATYRGAVPQRALDTRLGLGAPAGPIAAGHVVEVQVTGMGSPAVPADASAVVLNVTVTDPQAEGYVTVWPCGQFQPYTSTLNYVPGQTVPNAVVTGVGAAGRVCLFASAATNLVVDVNGWLPSGRTWVSQPRRLADTRTGEPGDGLPRPLEAGETLVVTPQVWMAGAVALNVTATDARAPGYLTVWPCGEPRPLASNVNYLPGATTPNAVLVGMGGDETVCVFTSATTDVVVDLSGYFPRYVE